MLLATAKKGKVRCLLCDWVGDYRTTQEMEFVTRDHLQFYHDRTLIHYEEPANTRANEVPNRDYHGLGVIRGREVY